MVFCDFREYSELPPGNARLFLKYSAKKCQKIDGLMTVLKNVPGRGTARLAGPWGQMPSLLMGFRCEPDIDEPASNTYV